MARCFTLEGKSNYSDKAFYETKKGKTRQLVAYQHLSCGQHYNQKQGFFSIHLTHLAPKKLFNKQKSSKSGDLEKQHVFQNNLVNKVSLNTIFKK